MQGGKRHALLIGVDKYSKLAPRHQLKGCANDVRLIGGILQDHFGFSEEHMVMLIDEAATRAGILREMDALVARVQPEDLVVIQFSGHGSRRYAIRPDEPTGLDSTLMPHDTGRDPHPSLDIIDDELSVWLAQLTAVTPFVTLLIDCCHSGTITRDAEFGGIPRGLEADPRSAGELGWPTEGSPLYNASYAGVSESAPRAVGPSGWLAQNSTYVLLAGCRDQEESNEFYVNSGEHRQRYGAMTYFLSQELVHAQPGTSYRDVFERVRRAVTLKYSKQHPQIEGPQDRELFGVRDNTPLQALILTAVDGQAVQLSGGAAHGLTIGSTWRVYPEAARADVTEADSVALLEVTALDVITASAVALPGGAALAVGMRCIEEAHAVPDLQLPVQLVTDGTTAERRAMEQAIDASRLLVLTQDAALAACRLYLAEPDGAADEKIADAEAKRLGAPCWVLVDEQSLLAAPSRRADGADAVVRVVENLEKLARYRNALALENTDQRSGLKGSLSLTLFQNRGGEWRPAEPNAGGELHYASEERIAFEIRHTHTQPLFVSLLDFGVTRSISLLYPFERSSYEILPDTPVRIGFEDDDAIELYIPDSHPEDEGVETFKLFATTTETDFSWLSQEGTRNAGRSGDSLLSFLFETAYEGPATREVRRRKPEPKDDWTTVQQAFVMTRRT